MCRVAQVAFPPALSAAFLARRWTAGHLRSWDLVALADTVLLLTSELVANAVVHAGSAPSVSLAVAEATIEVGVSDREVRLPPSPTTSADTASMAEEGRGLYLVDSIAEEWGINQQAGGKHIWFRLAVEDWSYRFDCRCLDPSDDLVPLASGHRAYHAPGPWDSVEPG